MFNAYFKKTPILKEAEEVTSVESNPGIPRPVEVKLYYSTITKNENQPAVVAAKIETITGTTKDIDQKVEAKLNQFKVNNENKNRTITYVVIHQEKTVK